MSWQRVESSTIDPAATDGLAARIADPLWLLARQWQVGEFRGEDAANPLLVSLKAQSVEVDEWRPGTSGDAAIRATDTVLGTPIEALVEAEPVAAGPGAPRLGAEVAQLLVALLRDTFPSGVASAVVAALRARYPISVPSDPDRRDLAGERRLAVLARHSFDALALAQELVDAATADPAAAARGRASLAAELIGSSSPTAGASLAATLLRWAASVAATLVLTAANESWSTERMEYQFVLGAQTGGGSTGTVLVSRDYHGGRLDWYSFDVGPRYTRDRTAAVTTYERELLPTSLRYAGMPASRFWDLEDGTVYYGDIDAAPEDLARVTLAAYAAIYGDDWLSVPLTVDAGTIVQVTQVVVLDDFGGATSIPATAVRDGPDRVFKFFELTGDPAPATGGAPILFLPPTAATTDAGRPLDDVSLGRDESANLVWAVERRIEGTYGRGVTRSPHARASDRAPHRPPPRRTCGPSTSAARFPPTGSRCSPSVWTTTVRSGSSADASRFRARHAPAAR